MDSPPTQSTDRGKRTARVLRRSSKSVPSSNDSKMLPFWQAFSHGTIEQQTYT